VQVCRRYQQRHFTISSKHFMQPIERGIPMICMARERRIDHGSRVTER
jgi:hypothetical protein